MNHEFTIHVGTHANNNSRWNTCKQQFTFPTQVTQPTTTNTGIFPAENGNRENGRKNSPTVPFPFPPVFPFCFPIFLFFSRKQFMVDLNGKRSRRDGIFASHFQPWRRRLAREFRDTERGRASCAKRIAKLWAHLSADVRLTILVYFFRLFYFIIRPGPVQMRL